MRLKQLLTTILFILTTTLASAEQGSISVTLKDAQLESMPIAGAIVEVTPKASPNEKLYYSTDGTGRFISAPLLYGDYSVVVSFLGYDTISFDVTIESKERLLSDIMMHSSSVQMDAVVKEIKALRASQNGDSLRYNASAYKVAEDADVDGLLSKMPGISVQDGEVTAQGEQITKIYVDGREFFGNDVAMALKSLPAEVVDRIEVYDKQSDEAEYSGVDDGNTTKSINIITKESMRQGIFGKIFGGGGYEPSPEEHGEYEKYMGGASLNIFKNSQRITVIGLINNLNQQNFSFEDIMGTTDDGSSTSNSSNFMVKTLPGLADVKALGINFSDVYGKDDRLKVQGSYFINQTKTVNTEDIVRWYEAPATDNIDSLYQTQVSQFDNLNIRLNGRIEYKINKRQSLMVRPSFSYQKSEPTRSYSGTRFEDSLYDNYDHQQQYWNSSTAIWEGFYGSINSNYRLRLTEDGKRTFAASVNFSLSDYKSATQSITEPSSTSSSTTNTYKYADAPNNKLGLTTNLSYNDKIRDKLFINFTYRMTYNTQESDKRTYTTGEDFDISTVAEDDIVVNYAYTEYLTHRIGPGLRYYFNKTNISANIYYQGSTLDYDIDKSGIEKSDGKEFNNIIYTLSGNVFFNRENSLKINLYSYTSNPPIYRYQDNTSSSTYVTKGNEDLNPTYSSRLRIRYIHSNLDKGSTLMMMCTATNSQDYGASHIVLTPNEFTMYGETFSEATQFTTYTNLDNYWNVYSSLTYGFPLDIIKCNLNLNLGVGYTKTPSVYGGEVGDEGVITGGEVIYTDRMSYNVGAFLGSNISKNFDFTISWSGEYNDASSAVSATSEKSENLYFNHTASISMKLVLGGRYTFTNSTTYKQYKGITNSYNDSYVLCGAYVGYKFLKNKRGELLAGVNDIFDQNTSFYRSVSSNYTQNLTNISLGRYYSVQFIYNLRHFGKGWQSEQRSSEF